MMQDGQPPQEPAAPQPLKFPGFSDPFWVHAGQRPPKTAPYPDASGGVPAGQSSSRGGSLHWHISSSGALQLGSSSGAPPASATRAATAPGKSMQPAAGSLFGSKFPPAGAPQPSTGDGTSSSTALVARPLALPPEPAEPGSTEQAWQRSKVAVRPSALPPKRGSQPLVQPGSTKLFLLTFRLPQHQLGLLPSGLLHGSLSVHPEAMGLVFRAPHLPAQQLGIRYAAWPLALPPEPVGVIRQGQTPQGIWRAALPPDLTPEPEPPWPGPLASTREL